jgi:hypothetical protein
MQADNNVLEFYNKKLPHVTVTIDLNKNLVYWGQYPMISMYTIVTKNMLNNVMGHFIIEHPAIRSQFKLKYSKEQLYIYELKLSKTDGSIGGDCNGKCNGRCEKLGGVLVDITSGPGPEYLLAHKEPVAVQGTFSTLSNKLINADNSSIDINKDNIYHFKLTKHKRLSFNITTKKVCVWIDSSHLQDAEWVEAVCSSSIGSCPTYKFSIGVLYFNPKNIDHGCKWNGSLIQALNVFDL